MSRNSDSGAAEALSATEIAELVADVLTGRDTWAPCVECDRLVDPRDEQLLGSVVLCPACYRLEVNARTSRF